MHNDDTHHEQTLPRKPYTPPTAHPIPATVGVKLDRLVSLDVIAQQAGVPVFKPTQFEWVDAHAFWDGPLEGLCRVNKALCLVDTFFCDTTNARRSYRIFSLTEQGEWWWFDHYKTAQVRRPTAWRYPAGAAWFADMLTKTRPDHIPPPEMLATMRPLPSRDSLLGVVVDYDDSMESVEPMVLWVEALLGILSTQNPVTITNLMSAVQNDRTVSTSKNQRPPFTPIRPHIPQIIRAVPPDPTRAASALPLMARVHLSSIGVELVITRPGKQGMLEVTAAREGDALFWFHDMGCPSGEIEELPIDHSATIELAQKILMWAGV